MSITSQSRRNNYLGTNSLSVYDYTFKLFSSADIEVKALSSVGLEHTLVLGTDYTVEFVNESTGGTVTLLNNSQVWLDGSGNLKSDYILSLLLNPVLKQATDIKNNTRYFPYLHERQFDKEFQILLAFRDNLDRAIRLVSSIDPADFSTELPEDILANGAGKFLAVNDIGNGIELRNGTTADLTDLEDALDALTSHVDDVENNSIEADNALSGRLDTLEAATSITETTSTFTPTLYGASSAGSTTYGSAVGKYVRHGLMIDCHIHLTVSAHTGTGQMRVGNLPFAAESGFNCFSEISYGTTKTPSGYVAVAHTADNQTYLNILNRKVGTGSAQNLQVSQALESEDQTVELAFTIRYKLVP